MKYYLWVLNSWLLGLFLICTGISFLLKQDVPRYRSKKIRIEEIDTEKLSTITINLEKIYKNDLFDTMVVPLQKPTKKNLVTPLPEMRAPLIPTPPEEEKPTFLKPVNIKINGLIISSHEQKSVAMIIDAQNKEGMYHVGEKIKDAQIIKIGRNRVVLLRSNGQQEIYYLRKEEANKLQDPEIRFKFLINKIDDQTFELDPDELKKEVHSVGELLEQAYATTAYQKGSPLGVKIGMIAKNGLVEKLGFKENDIITAINGSTIETVKQRLAVFESLQDARKGEAVTINVNRDGKTMTNTYTLKRLEDVRKNMFLTPKKHQKGRHKKHEKTAKEKLFTMNRLQERENQIRQFERQHPSNQQQMILDLRKRLLKNMKERSQNMRVR